MKCSRYPNLIVCRGLCKAYGLAGLRIGYSASCAQVADILNRVRQPFNINSLALAAARAALDNDAYSELGLQVNRQGLLQLQNGLTGLNLAWIPARTNFVTVDFGRSAEPIYESLLTRAIIVRPLSGYGMFNHLRISVGLKSENNRLLTASRQLLNEESTLDKDR